MHAAIGVHDQVYSRDIMRSQGHVRGDRGPGGFRGGQRRDSLHDGGDSERPTTRPLNRHGHRQLSGRTDIFTELLL